MPVASPRRAAALAAALLLLVAGGGSPAAGARDPEALLGWAESPAAGARGRAPGLAPGDRAAGGGAAPRDDRLPGDQRRRGPEVLSWDPRIFLYRGLLSDAECDAVRETAEPRLTRSGVVAATKDESDISDVRTSYGMFYSRGENAVIKAIETRLSEWTMIPAANGEGIQVLRYRHDQEYKPHYDAFFHAGGEANGGNRLATALMYLTDVEEGGETIFPNVPAPPEQLADPTYTACAQKGLAVKPRKGDAVVFWTLRTDGTLDRGSMHGSCPVVRGVKYAATKWWHVARYAMDGEPAVEVHHVVFRPPPPPAPPGCVNDNPACAGWAEGGECENNPGYMVGTKQAPGACLLACGRCDLAPTAPTTSRLAKKLNPEM